MLRPKYKLFCQFCWVRIKGHPQLISRFAYVLKIFRFVAGSQKSSTTENRGMSLRNSLAEQRGSGGRSYIQTLTNPFLGPARSRTPVLQYLLVNVLPY